MACREENQPGLSPGIQLRETVCQHRTAVEPPHDGSKSTRLRDRSCKLGLGASQPTQSALVPGSTRQAGSPNAGTQFVCVAVIVGDEESRDRRAQDGRNAGDVQLPVVALEAMPMQLQP